MRPLGLVEVSRTGVLSILRGAERTPTTHPEELP